MRKAAIFIRGFRPPTRAHTWVVQQLATLYPTVIVRPRGTRKDGEFDPLSDEDRARMARMAFEGINDRRVQLDLSEIGRPMTPAIELYERYRAAGIDPVFVIPAGLILNGETGQSDIHNKWKDGERLWNTARFRVVAREEHWSPDDFPPNVEGPVITCKIRASSTSVREEYADGNVDAAERQLKPSIAALIREHGLFRQIESSI